jgi:hypothetical protein
MSGVANNAVQVTKANKEPVVSDQTKAKCPRKSWKRILKWTLTAVDRAYKSLSDIPEAIRYLDQGHARGKVVIAVE